MNELNQVPVTVLPDGANLGEPKTDYLPGSIDVRLFAVI